MKRWFVVAALVATSAFAQAQPVPTPPVAAQKSYTVKGPVERNDPYYWLRDDTRKNADMLGYLKAENAYADAVLAPTKPLQDKLYKELLSHIKETDDSVPYKDGDWYYYVTVNLATGETKFGKTYQDFLSFKREYTQYCTTSDRC